MFKLASLLGLAGVSYGVQLDTLPQMELDPFLIPEYETLFNIFDQDKDGEMTSIELWCLMTILGL